MVYRVHIDTEGAVKEDVRADSEKRGKGFSDVNLLRNLLLQQVKEMDLVWGNI